MNFVHSEDNVATPTHHDGEFVLDARAWNSIAARIMMSASSTSSSSVSGSGGGGGGGNTTIGENLAARGTARRGNLARSWNYDTPSGQRRSGRLPNGNDFEDEDGHVDENDRGDVERERVSLSFLGGMTRSKSTPSLRINEQRSTEEGAHAAEYSDGTDGVTCSNRSNNRNHINSNNNRDKRSTSRRRQVLGSWLQSHAASATSPNSTDRDGDTASKSSWKSKLKSMRSKSTPRSRSRSSSQQQPQPQPQQSFGTRPRSNPTPFPRSAPLDTSHLKSRTAAPNSPTAAVSASSTQSRQPLIQKSKSAKSMSFHNNYQKHPSPGLTKAASFSNNNPNEKINNAIQTCQIHPEVRIRRNQCPLCAAEQTKKLRRSFHGSVRHRGSANDATAAAETAAPKNDCNDDDDGDGDDSNLKDGRPIDKVTVPSAAIHSAVARTTGSNPDLEFVDSSQVDIEVNSWNGGKRQQPQAQPQPPQQQQKSTCPWTQWSKHSANNDRNDSRHRDCDSNINGNDYTPNSNDDDAKKHDDDNESDTTSQESDRDRAGNVVDGIIHNFLEKMRLLSNQHGRQHQERQSGRDEVEEVEADDCLNDGNFENRGGDAEIDFYVGDGRRDDESDDVTDRRGDYTGYIHPQNESFENSNHYHGSRDECNDDENSLRGFHGHLSDHHIPYKYQHSFDDDAKVSNEGIWRSRPLEEESLPVLPVEHSREHKHSFYAEDPVSGEWKESKPFRSSLNGSELPKPQLQSHHSMDKDDDAIAKPSLKSSLTTLSELQKTILLATQSIGKFSPSEDEYDDRDFVGDDHHPVDEYHKGDDSDFLPVSGSGNDDDNDGIFHRQYERISPSNSLEDNDRSYLPKGLHHHILSHKKKNDENAIFDDEDCYSRESTDDEGSISSMARRGDQPAKRFAESKGSYMPANCVVPTSVAEEKNPYVRDALEDRSQFYQQRESVRTRQVLPQHERQEQEPSEPPLEVDCDSNSSGSSVTMDEFSSSRSLSSKSSSIAQEKRVGDVNRLDPIASKENEAEKDSGHAKEMKHLPENRVSFALEDEAGFPEVAGDVPEYDSERLIPKPKNAEENISPCTVILNDDNSEVQLPFGPPFSKVESKPETESFRGNKDSEVGDQPTEVTENSKILVEEKSQMHSQRQGRPTKRSSLRSSLKENGRSRRSSSGTKVEAEVSGDAKFDETVVSRAASKSSHQPSFFSALVQNSRQARSHSKTRTRARSRSKSRTRKAAKVVSVEDPKHQAAGKQEEEVSTPAKIDDKENIKDMGVKEDVNLANAEAPQDQVPREKPSAKIIEPKTLDETPKKRKKSGTKPDPPRNIRGPIAHPYYKLGDVAREEDMIIFPKKNSRSRRRRRRRRRHRSKSRTASLSSSDSSSSSDSDSDSDNDSDDDNLDEREARRKHSIYMSIKELRHLDAAFVKRSDGTWTYAIVCDWIDDEVRFVVNGRGSTKSIPQNIWRSNVRRIKVLSQRSGDNFISKDSASRKKRTIGRGRSSNKSARAKGRMVSPSPTRRTSTMNYMPTIAEDKRYNHF